ncbi:hypothetical protein FB451DRAFT_1394892 [Mycena latifolia]|nr:hypothetical protein FB451DRAFT_1394892 [Mycena latifolia]
MRSKNADLLGIAHSSDALAHPRISRGAAKMQLTTSSRSRAHRFSAALAEGTLLSMIYRAGRPTSCFNEVISPLLLRSHEKITVRRVQRLASLAGCAAPFEINTSDSLAKRDYYTRRQSRDYAPPPPPHSLPLDCCLRRIVVRAACFGEASDAPHGAGDLPLWTSLLQRDISPHSRADVSGVPALRVRAYKVTLHILRRERGTRSLHGIIEHLHRDPCFDPQASRSCPARAGRCTAAGYHLRGCNAETRS